MSTGQGWLPRVWVALGVILISVPSIVSGAWTDFAPRSFENGVFLDVSTSFERDQLREGTRSARWTDTFVREKLSLFSNGYSYHPRFLQYQFSIAGSGKQEDFQYSNGKSLGWRNGTGLEYETHLFFLPEHPYNLALFYRRFEPLFKEQTAALHSSVQTSRGASLRYRKKPYFLHASYGDDSIESTESSSDVTRFALEGEYFKQYQDGNELVFTGAVNPSWFSTSQGVEGNSTEYLLGNFLRVWRAQLTSNLSKDVFLQESPSSGKFENDGLVWHERLAADLPWNLRSDLSYRFQDSESTIHDPRAASVRTLSDEFQGLRFQVAHRLYQSLDTSYALLRDSRGSSGGETTSLSHALASDYAKSIPRGRIMAGVSVSRADMENRGQADIVNEPHLATSVPGSFSLLQQNIEQASIAVFLTCTSETCPPPLVKGEIVRLEEGRDYITTPLLNTFQITVFHLQVDGIVLPPGPYDFFVSYSLASGDFGLRSDAFGGNVSLGLFNDLVTPYFSHVSVKSEVVSGTFQGTPVDSKTYTAGLVLRTGPLQMRGEYQELQWEVSPHQTWRADVQYVHSLSRTTSLFATASYLNRYYSRGTSGYYPVAFTEETESASAAIQKQLFSRNMYVSLGGSYVRLQGLVDANAYSLNTSLTWRIGTLELTAGASGFLSDTKGTTDMVTRRDHQFVYANLRRRLF